MNEDGKVRVLVSKQSYEFVQQELREFFRKNVFENPSVLEQ